MAGIGFKLKDYFSSISVTDRIKGSVYSVTIACGPWLMSIITIAIISIWAQRVISNHELLVFKSIISYSFAASLIFFGMIEMPITRYLADKLYIEDKSSFKYTFLFIVMITVIIGSVLGGIFYSFFEFKFWKVLGCIVLFSTIVSIWLSMVFLSAAKNFKQITYGFIFGNLLTLVVTYFSGKYYGMTGYVLGYACGQIGVAAILGSAIRLEFAGREYLSFEFLSYFKKQKTLMILGTFYYCGIWVDKFIFWLTPSGKFVEGLFYTNQFYDTAMFLAYLSIIPSIAIFFVHVETDFYMHYAYFFRSIDHKANLPFLEKNIEGINESLKRSMLSLLKFQSFISVIVWYFSHEIIVFLGLPTLMIPIFRYGLIGAYLQAFFIFCNIILLYFLAEKQVLKNYGIFFLTNMVFTYISAYGDFKFYGLGYAMSSFLTFLVSYVSLNRRLETIDVHTFMEQPVIHKPKLTFT
jgi:polysaccharide biosynthesis protein PelG